MWHGSADRKGFDGLYAKKGWPSIPPERLLRTLLLEIFYSVRSERMLMEQLSYNLLFSWFVGMEMDEPVWNHAVFSKNLAAAESGRGPRVLRAHGWRRPNRIFPTSTSPWMAR